ncbi:MAG TPA: LysR family transcriptional regulator [Kofleriaceae bacterium]|nr:LysR family transcriptional regulator [Kofleriaceae bacterium]
MSKLPDPVDLVVLARVLERGSFARAAAELGVPPSTLSRKVAGLERRLGVRVLERTTRSLRPTEVGELLAERGRRVREELEGAERAVADHQRAPRGLLRLSVPTPVADQFLGPAVGEYLARYPDMRVEIHADDRMVDLVTEGFDVAIRVAKLRDSSLGTIRLAEVRAVLAASPRYLERAPVLRHPRDLAAHAVIQFGRKRRVSWSFVGRGGQTETVELSPRSVASSAPLVAELAAAGAGIAMLPRFVATSAQLTILEPGGFRCAPVDLSIVTPSARPAAPKVRAFVDVMREYVAARTDMFDAVFPRNPK